MSSPGAFKTLNRRESLVFPSAGQTKRRLEADVGGSSVSHGGGRGTARGTSGWDPAPPGKPRAPVARGGAELAAPPSPGDALGRRTPNPNQMGEDGFLGWVFFFFRERMRTR